MDQSLREIPNSETAAYLRSVGLPIVSTRDLGRSGVIFLFHDSDKLEQLLLDLANGMAVVDPLKLFTAWRTVRSLVQGSRR